MDLPTGILPPKVKRGGAEPTRFLGKFITGKASPAELAAAAQTAKLDPEDLDDRLAPHTYGLLLETYGADKRAEVEEALKIAKDLKFGDIAGKLEAWLKAHPAGGRRRKTRRRKTRMAKKSRRTYK